MQIYSVFYRICTTLDLVATPGRQCKRPEGKGWGTHRLTPTAPPTKVSHEGGLRRHIHLANITPTVWPVIAVVIYTTFL